MKYLSIISYITSVGSDKITDYDDVSVQKKEKKMNAPEWTKPALWGAVGGAVAMAFAALAPICVAQARSDPQSAVTMAKLKETSTYQRGSILMEAGWATMPGSTDPNRAVANACMTTLAAEF
jgi:hypothetical protein